MLDNKYSFRSLLFCWFFLGTIAIAQAQISDSLAPQYAGINEDLFINTKWKYTYTTHAESNTVIHQADEDYAYFIFFKYDYTTETYLNGNLSIGSWELNKAENEVHYPFRKVDWWRLAQFDEDNLILEFTMNRKSSYRYHFIRVSNQEAPFERSPNDLPDVNVDFGAPPQSISESDYSNFLKKRGIKYKKGVWERRQARLKRKEERRVARLQKTARGRAILAREAPKEHMQVELMGGGFFGGVDPVYKNMILIKTDGHVIREYHSAQQGLQVQKYYISREQLEELVAYIENKRFFDFDQTYTCNSPACQKRMSDKPRPIALRIAITKGVQRKIITIPIWDGRGKKNALIDYPEELDAIVQAIENIANHPPQ